MQDLAVKISNLSKKYQDKIIFDNLNFEINQRDFVSILGSNGVGKSTLIKCIANIEKYNGTIYRHSSSVGYVSQDAKEMILPWLNVKSNLIFPLKKENVDYELFNQLLEISKLKEHLNKYPHQLSGGMIQVLLIVRAILNQSKILLIDEPFKSLDYEISKNLQQKLIELWQTFKITIIMISHNIDDAVMMSNKIIVFSKRQLAMNANIIINKKNNFDIDRVINEKNLDIKNKVLNEILNR
jgi:NitT/TauT family transport system ATP-binding protein